MIKKNHEILWIVSVYARLSCLARNDNIEPRSSRDRYWGSWLVARWFLCLSRGLSFCSWWYRLGRWGGHRRLHDKRRHRFFRLHRRRRSSQSYPPSPRSGTGRAREVGVSSTVHEPLSFSIKLNLHSFLSSNSIQSSPFLIITLFLCW